ncbi:MAG: hypothetical protein CMP11_07870 [Zetaproteobacteria bacterium]|nr:hypothetical protein [Pseudobdellovibrionaceae bacterium]|tara:strand:+ start:270 stop:623 length:354 start_codon:yes stop_codon:yes gene_type:complete
MEIGERKYPRYPCKLKVLVVTQGNEKNEMMCLDVSLVGLRLESLERFIVIEPREEIKVLFPATAESSDFELKGVIKHYSQEESGQVVFGVEIIHQNTNSHNYWQEHMKKLVLTKVKI